MMANAKGADKMNDDGLVNEMFKSIVKNEIRAGYPILTEDHFFSQLVIDFMSDKRIWLGTASDLISDMNCKTVSAKPFLQIPLQNFCITTERLC